MFRVVAPVVAQAEDRVAGPVAAQEAVRRRQDLRDRSRCRVHSSMQ
jgi:hypothetical protein